MALLANIRKGTRDLFRFLFQPILRPINQRFALMLSRIETLERQVAALRQASVVDRATSSADDRLILAQRVDSLIDAWLLLENEVSRLGAQIAEATADVKVEWRAAQTLRLNLGPGRIMNPACLNVGSRWRPGLDVVAQLHALPFKPGSVDAIFAAWLLDHFPRQDLQERLLPHWCSLLRPGGRLRIIATDDRLLFPDCLQRLVQEAGFTAVNTPLRGRKDGQRFEFELTAESPATAIPP